MNRKPRYLEDETIYWFDVLRDAAALAFVLLMALLVLWWLT